MSAQPSDLLISRIRALCHEAINSGEPTALVVASLELCEAFERLSLGGWKALLAAVERELTRAKHWGKYPERWQGTENAPGHSHSIKGIWDSDNGDIAGTECSWCLAWNAARKALSEAAKG
jgi:hypothetical protein